MVLSVTDAEVCDIVGLIIICSVGIGVRFWRLFSVVNLWYITATARDSRPDVANSCSICVIMLFNAAECNSRLMVLFSITLFRCWKKRVWYSLRKVSVSWLLVVWSNLGMYALGMVFSA